MCFHATLSICPTRSFPHCVHKSVLYACISSAALRIGSSYHLSRLHACVAQLCWMFRDCSPPGSSVHGVFQARILEQVAIPKGSSWLRDWTWVSCIASGFFTIWFFTILYQGSPSGILLSHKKCILVSSNEMNEPRAYLQSEVSQKEKINIIY